MDNIQTLYIYSKDFQKQWKVLNHENAKLQHEDLIKQGWFHDSTIDPIIYIENLLNNQNN